MFHIDERILNTSTVLGEWELSTVLLKNEAIYPWIILVPKREGKSEIYQLDKVDQVLLMDEIHKASIILKDFFSPYKLNVGSLGNIVEQLHIHIVGRNKEDPLWPQGIWQSSFDSVPYKESAYNSVVDVLKNKVKR